MGGGKVLAMLKGGTTSFEAVLTQEHEPLPILKRGGGGAKTFGPAIFPSRSPAPLPRN